ncbi:MAG: hypothetical protein KBA81_06940 [Rhabdochlamydiaceae bacterium]|nr:hypothetical protein [Rhabdochlamydiaceae bacterium]
MKFSEAMLMLEQGKKIRRKTWRPDAYYIFIHDCILDENNLPVFMAVDTSLKADWEEYVEPKKKRIVKMWPAVLKSDSHGLCYFLSTILYDSIEDAKKDYARELIRLATEYPAIEIETTNDE